MFTLLGKLGADRRGGLMAEFAAAMPVLVLMLLGGVEISRFALLNQRMDRLATVVADLVSQADSLTQADLDAIFAAVNPIAWPFDMTNGGNVIVSALWVPPPPDPAVAKITWQRHAGNLPVDSKFGVENAAPTLPAGLNVGSNQTMIAAEVFYRFRPFLIGALVPEQNVYHRAFFRPRTGSLKALGS
jgi:Flp pilus assembly protein TadG